MRDPNQSSPTYPAYFSLMRLSQPTGIWLLLWPCWWAAALAAPDSPPLGVLGLFFIGAFLMRPAGCIVNDLADRKFDAQVARTKDRPLASGDVTPGEAFRLFLWLLFLAFLVAMALGKEVVLWAAFSLPLVLLYPWMKRISWWPQLFLGFTFNWGALLGWVAIRGVVEPSALWLYAGGVCWTLGYDTIYAHQDKEDDRKAGIKSSALRLGKHTKPALVIFYTLAVSCWLAAGQPIAGHIGIFHAFLGMAWLHLLWQVRAVDLDDPASCRRIFASNGLFGWIMFAACLAANNIFNLQ